jgi:hypothetical protein
VSDRNTVFGSYSLTVGQVEYAHLEIGLAVTASPDEMIAAPDQRIGEYPLGGQPGMGDEI